MKLIYTVCTANHLHQALSLGESLRNTNPDYELIIGLVDETPITNFIIPHQIIPILEVQPLHLSGFKGEYSVFELTMTCKSVFGIYLFQKYPELEKLIYCDTDLWFLDNLSDVENKLDSYDIILTPHISEPIDLREKWNEKQFLNAGLYNAGFMAFRRSENTLKFLYWWKKHLENYGYYDFCNGMGVDQLCLNFVPIFHDKVLIEYSPSYNLAYWNLHERTVEKIGEKYLINGKNKLLFFHFSGYSLEKPNSISKHTKSSKTSDYPILKPLFEEYNLALLKNYYSFFKQIIPAYGKYNPSEKEKNFVLKLIEKSVWKVINFIDNY